MLKKTITYEDFNGNTVTEDFFFHLSKADLVELEMSHKGGLGAMLQSIIDAEDGAAIITEFKKLLLMAYGKKSSDGRRFIKNEALREEFLSTEAYSTLFMELVTDAGAATAFVNGIVPANLEQEMQKLKQPIDKIHDDTLEIAPRILTRTEVANMPAEEFQRLLSTGEAVFQG